MNVNKIYTFQSKKRILNWLILLGFILSATGYYYYVGNVFPLASLTNLPPNKSAIISHWKLVFEDEFDSKSLNTNKWNMEDSYVTGYHNCCLFYGMQYFTPEALSFWQGALRITTHSQLSNNHYIYTSGAITTQNKFSFTYGRVDIRARLPKTQGFWPALWLLSYNTDFEIDIMELRGQDPNKIHMTNIWGHGQNDQVYATYTGPDYSKNYHVFSIIWSPSSITWFIDDVQRFQTSTRISDKSMYLIINSSLGGRWVGNPDSSTIYPQYMDIDYVRIYQHSLRTG